MCGACVPSPVAGESLAERVEREQGSLAIWGSKSVTPSSKRRAVAPIGGERVKRVVPKPDGKARFTCKHPGCGKAFASTDAVRKHCRQRHLEWLRGLGHGCPELYCEWSENPNEYP